MRKCELCRATTNKKRKRSTIERHHISYKPPIVMDLCKSCHTIVSNYERNPDVYNTDDPRFAILKQYDKLKPTKQPEEREGTQVLSIRLTDNVLYTIHSISAKKGMTVSAFIKEKVEEYVRLKSANIPVDTKTPVKQNNVVRPNKLEGRLRSLGLKMEGNKIVGVSGTVPL